MPISEAVRQAFWSKVEVQQTGTILGLDEGLEAAFAASQDAPASVPVAWAIETFADDGKECLNAQFTAIPSVAAQFNKPYHRVTPLFAAPVPQATEWLDISTAPRDGTRFLAAEYDDSWIIGICRWCKTPHVPLYGFHFTDGDPEDWEISHPTHWMPLPAAPTPKAEGEQQ